MKIYLAARYSSREQMKKYREILHEHGHEVTSRWLDFADMPESFEWYDKDIHGPDDSGHAAPEYREGIAISDIEDVMRADATMLFTPGGTRGGCFVEWGAAIASRQYRQILNTVKEEFGETSLVLPTYRLILIGPRINIFQNYPGVEVFNDWPDQFLNFMDALAALDERASA